MYEPYAAPAVPAGGALELIARADPALTLIELDPLIEPVAVSVTVMVSVPAV